MDTHWIILFVCIIPFWFMQNVIHELSHGLTIYFGWKWKFKIWPFPSKKLGRFTFAHTKYIRTEKSKDLSYIGRAFVSIAPQLVNVFFLISTSYILLTATISLVWSAILVLFMWTNSIDLSVNLLSILRSPNNSDIWKFKRYLDIPLNRVKYSCIGVVVYQAIALIITTLVVLF